MLLCGSAVLPPAIAANSYFSARAAAIRFQLARALRQRRKRTSNELLSIS
jgi:hypothetical protein